MKRGRKRTVPLDYGELTGGDVTIESRVWNDLSRSGNNDVFYLNDPEHMVIDAEREIEQNKRDDEIREFILKLKSKLTPRQRKILYTILETGGIDTRLLEQVTGRSRRTIYYEIAQIKRISTQLWKEMHSQ